MATLDVFLRKGTEIVGIESKFLEYFTPKLAEFATCYTRTALPWEECWWSVREEAPKADKRNLDVAQLVKHYLGLSRLFNKEELDCSHPTLPVLGTGQCCGSRHLPPTPIRNRRLGQTGGRL